MELAARGLLSSLPAAFLAGADRDLLAPLAWQEPGRLAAVPPPRATPARRDLAAALGVANQAYGHPRAAELARRLADPATRVVVAGQQPGLFGGPLYTLAKMVAAARWAAALEAAGEPAVAVFWVATEDHDWPETSAATVLTPEGPRTFDLGPDPAPLTPVGMRTLGPAVSEVLAGLAQAVPGDPWAGWVATLGRWYRPDARFGEAFCRLMAHLLGGRCPLLLDAMHPALKAAQRPWLRRLVERRQAVEEASVAREAEIERRGHALQVHPQRGVSPLFLYSRGERRRVEWQGGEAFALRGREGSAAPLAALLAAIEDNPGVVSAGVLARPAVQDAVLGTSLQVLGPGEVAYMAQAAALYPVLEVEPPAIALRPQMLVLEAKQLERLGELAGLGVTLADLLGDRHALERQLAERAMGDPVTPVRGRVEAALAELRDPALAVDAGLERPYEKTREQVLRALDLFAEKLAAAAARHNEVASRRLDQLRDACLPQGKLQERVISSAYFPGRHGERFVAALWEQMDLDPAFLQGVTP